MSVIRVLRNRFAPDAKLPDNSITVRLCLVATAVFVSLVLVALLAVAGFAEGGRLASKRGYDNVHTNGAATETRPQTSYTVSSRTCGSSYAIAFAASVGGGNRSQASIIASTRACAGPVSSCTGVKIGTTTDLAQAVSNSHAGTTFCIKTGVHRLTRPVNLKSRDRLIGEPGAVLNGSRRLTKWTHSGSIWVISGQTQQHIGKSLCQSSHPLCNNKDDVFFDDRPLRAVGRLSAVGRGTFFFDYPNDKIYIGKNPAGHKVEGTITYGIGGCSSVCGPGTLISGLVIEKFSGGGIEISDGTVKNNEVRWNHTTGIGVARDGVIRDNYVHDNGKTGLGSAGGAPRRNLLVESNQIAHNGWYAGYDPGWESGGGKWTTGVNNLRIRNNYIHANRGPGVWLDTNNIHVTIDGNRIEDNTDNGIAYEASYDAVISNNTIRRNGFRSGGPWMEGAGILNTSSANVEVYGNVVEGNYDGIGAEDRRRGIGPYGPREVINFYVHDNLIKTAGTTGVIETDGDKSFFTSKNNRFVHNSYSISCQTTAPFAWMDKDISWSTWTGYGNDTTGSFSTHCRPPTACGIACWKNRSAMSRRPLNTRAV
jgi:parallel beta-helix repeat protein